MVNDNYIVIRFDIQNLTVECLYVNKRVFPVLYKYIGEQDFRKV